MVRMSDLVRGIVRESPPAPLPERPAPSERSAEPAEVTPMRLMSLASLGTPPPIEREDPVPPEPEPRVPEPPPRVRSRSSASSRRSSVRRSSGCTAAAASRGARLQALVDRAISALARSADLFWVANNPAVPAGVDYIAFHQARVCVLALRIGGGVGYDARGSARSAWPPRCSTWPSGRCRSHPAPRRLAVRRGARALALAPAAVGRHRPPLGPARRAHRADDPRAHEREQGQGFPQGLHGPAIDPDAKIIALVDTYTALTVPPSSRPAAQAPRGDPRDREDAQRPVPVGAGQALLSEISVFPPGTVVRLNTDEVGRVIAVNRHHPLRRRWRSSPTARAAAAGAEDARPLRGAVPVHHRARRRGRTVRG